MVERGGDLGLVIAGDDGAEHEADVEQEPGHSLKLLVLDSIPLISGDDLVSDDGHEVVQQSDEKTKDREESYYTWSSGVDDQEYCCQTPSCHGRIPVLKL